ncbi:MAG TPA: glycoside hydrolase family 3 C-terminal domain-containing protein [Acidobacteriaceae bacterium]|nr:glycoside hydrolase family 3 C-terminal domain-containing protein [Acidobacteriaceae bacterium]
MKTPRRADHCRTDLHPGLRRIPVIMIALVLAVSTTQAAHVSRANTPWMNAHLSPDRRADLVIQQMTLDEKIQLVHGSMAMHWQELGLKHPIPGALNGDGFVPGIPRLGIPNIQLIGAGVGVTDMGNRPNGESTALPSSLAETASWDPEIARQFGAVIGKETRDEGFNVSLGGGIDLTREPRDGRNFEYHGEDPLLAGEMVGAELEAIQAQSVIADIKHYAVNDQESGRNSVSSNVDKRSMRETDLLAFEIAIERSHVGTVMCSYNRVNGVYACENRYLITDVLKHDWGFQGWVMSDWGATHSTVPAALAGLDQEFFANHYFAAPLKAAVLDGRVPMSRLDDMDHRILRTMFAFGVVDHPPIIRPVDFQSGAKVAQQVEEQGCVLLKNKNHLLPLQATDIKSIAVIGAHANLAVLSGGGSAQVIPQGGNAIPQHPQTWTSPVWDPSSPLAAIVAQAPRAKVSYNEGIDPATAAQLAKAADVAIVFVQQQTHEDADLPTLELPDHQDDLVRAVAAANPRTIVVAETGGAFLMPWIDQVDAILEAWYPGIRGGPAIGNILFGAVNPSGKLPITFPKSDADLPHPALVGPPKEADKDHPPFFDVNYTEGLKVGYKWYDAEKKQPLFPFGFGLSYTTFSYCQLRIVPNGTADNVRVTFVIKNIGPRAGAEVAQAYLALPPSAKEPPHRLVGWQKVRLEPGESRSVAITVPPRMLATFNVEKDDWQILAGSYQLSVGNSSRQLSLHAPFTVNAAELAP